MLVDGFDWDEWNRDKCQKHGLSIEHIESLFQRTIVVLPDPYGGAEERFRAIGKDSVGRYVFIVFCYRLRDDKILIRPISARYMHQKEIDAYEEAKQ